MFSVVNERQKDEFILSVCLVCLCRKLQVAREKKKKQTKQKKRRKDKHKKVVFFVLWQTKELN